MTPNRAGLIVRGGRVIDPAQNIDRVADVLLADGRVIEVTQTPLESTPDDYEVVDASGLVIAPGFIDLHTHLREPGEEHKETISTGTLAAARGGFTTVCAMPNTQPAQDNASVIELVMQLARETAAVRVLPIGAVTVGRLGGRLADLAEMAAAGSIGFSDDGDPVADAELMRGALELAADFGLPIINHCQEPSLTRGAQMNEGELSSRLSLTGWPAEAEASMVARDIALAERSGGRLHLAHVSTESAVRHLTEAKEQGIEVTAEATPHHLTLTDAWVLGRHGDVEGPIRPDGYDTSTKVNPPLRSEADRAAVAAALADGTIDFIATDHAPHAESDKSGAFEEAANGISCLETAFGSVMGLVHDGVLDLPTLIDRLAASPARFLGTELGSLKPGYPADVVLLDPDAEWTVRAHEFVSLGKNTPLDGVTLRGRVVATIYAGQQINRLEREGAGVA